MSLDKFLIRNRKILVFLGSMVRGPGSLGTYRVAPPLPLRKLPKEYALLLWAANMLTRDSRNLQAIRVVLRGRIFVIYPNLHNDNENCAAGEKSITTPIGEFI